MPYIVLPLVKTTPIMVSLLFVICSLFGTIASIVLPREPLGRPLDEKSEDLDEELLEQNSQ